MWDSLISLGGHDHVPDADNIADGMGESPAVAWYEFFRGPLELEAGDNLVQEQVPEGEDEAECLQSLGNVLNLLRRDHPRRQPTNYQDSLGPCEQTST